MPSRLRDRQMDRRKVRRPLTVTVDSLVSSVDTVEVLCICDNASSRSMSRYLQPTWRRRVESQSKESVFITLWYSVGSPREGIFTSIVCCSSMFLKLPKLKLPFIFVSIKYRFYLCCWVVLPGCKDGLDCLW